MINVITQSSKEIQAQIDEDLKNYRELYCNTELSPKQIRKQLNITKNCASHKNINKQMKDEISPQKRVWLIKKDEWL